MNFAPIVAPASDDPGRWSEAPARICFLYIAQRHQVLHSLPIALALSRRWPQYEVSIAGTTRDQLDYIDRLTDRLGERRLETRLLGPAPLRALRRGEASVPAKTPLLIANAGFLRRFAAIVTPERKTTLLRRLGLLEPLLVYTQHGAGDRGGPFEARLRRFDLVMASGEKLYERIVGSGLAKPEDCEVVGYPKFDIVDALPAQRPRLFAQARQTVLYNPHFDRALSSWPSHGLGVLRAFAADPRYNLIFAPHVRLFDGDRRGRRQLSAFAAAPNIHIALHDEAMFDMTLVDMADIYLGDVSSQVYEFIRRPRPCVFLNTHGVAWVGNRDYRSWTFGAVVTKVEDVITAVARASQQHEWLYRANQQRGFAETFDLQPQSSSERAAAAIVRRLRQRRPGPSDGAS